MQSVKLKGENTEPENTVGMWHHLLNEKDLVTETWFLRQMTKDEVTRKARAAPIFSPPSHFYDVNIYCTLQAR